MYYRVPRQVTLDGRIFVDSVELSAVITPDTELIGISGANNELALRTIKEGAELRIRTALDPEGAPWLEVLQVLP